MPGVTQECGVLAGRTCAVGALTLKQGGGVAHPVDVLHEGDEEDAGADGLVVRHACGDVNGGVTHHQSAGTLGDDAAEHPLVRSGSVPASAEARSA